MQDQLHTHAARIAVCAQSLLADTSLTVKQRDVIKTILTAAERFVHAYAECLVMSIDDFVANMRHEVGNPLTPIYGYAEMLMAGMVGTISEQQRNYVRQILDSTHVLRNGVDAMLSQARMQLAISA